jgi:hypothetical protein
MKNISKITMQLLFCIGVMFLSTHVYAVDLLAGTTADALDTVGKSGRNWIYIIDGAISVAAFAKTKNPFVFFSVLAVALAITVILKMAATA